jgi:putative Holliday junction resolvase
VTTEDGPASEGTDAPTIGRILAVDWGERRVGIAVSDPRQTVAHPVDVLTRRTGRRFPLQRLRAIIDKYRPVGIIVGLPLSAAGTEDDAARHARDAGELIRLKTGLPVAYVDERMTTARVRSDMRQHPASATKGKPIDDLAATVLLQAFLDGRAR